MKFGKTTKVLFFASVLISQMSWGWGETAHQIVTNVGATITSNGDGYFQANAATFAHLATVPDVVWKPGPDGGNERPTHWFQADYYYPSCSLSDIETFPKSYNDAVTKYTEKVVLAQGTAPWRVKQFYNLAVSALQSGDVNSATQYIGVMSHYIGDMSQPLHDSENYDGAMTSSDGKATGIHAFFESSNISANSASTIQSNVQAQAEKLLADPSFTGQFTGDLMDVLYHEVARALSFRDQILNDDKNLGRTGNGASTQLTTAESRMADGAATFAIILEHLFNDSGVTSKYGAVTVTDPSWVAPDFSSAAPWLARYSPIKIAPDDDCITK